MANALAARTLLINGSCRESASAAEQLGSVPSPCEISMIEGKSSVTVRNRVRLWRLMSFIGWPRTNCPLLALFPMSSQ